ncbi:MAG: hypothetical protein BGO67_03520 [Alphaproteobacteria bacterium 41-28]|nr:MAG: hypothetical protein BGO67_03520 [Alphaproteobacteria bacterium 41-28]
MSRFLLSLLITLTLSLGALADFTIEADLDHAKTPRMFVDEDTEEDSRYENGWFEINNLRNYTKYDDSDHKFIISGLTLKVLEEIQSKKEKQSGKFKLTKEEGGFSFNFSTYYKQYTTGRSEEEPSYWHYFKIFIPDDIRDGTTIKATLNEIWHTPSHDG